MNKENLKIVENKDIVAVYSDSLTIDISRLNTKDKYLVVIYSKENTYINAKNITAKGVVISRFSGGDFYLLHSEGVITDTELNWLNNANKLINMKVH